MRAMRTQNEGGLIAHHVASVFSYHCWYHNKDLNDIYNNAVCIMATSRSRRFGFIDDHGDDVTYFWVISQRYSVTCLKFERVLDFVMETN